MNDTNWETKVIKELATSALEEQRKARRWGIFFKLLAFGYLFLLFFMFTTKETTKIPGVSESHAAVVDVKGYVAENEEASAKLVIEGLRDAFEAENAKSIILDINSPGGSPVQAQIIYNEILRLKALHPSKKVYAVASDLCASAAYYVAAAGDEIYASNASLVGSIGVLMDGFGFVDTMKKIGAERRLLTAGKHKGLLDPFSNVKENEREFVLNMLGVVHQQFIDSVKAGRGDKLSDNPDIFSGLIWTGQQALPLGLIDGIGTVDTVAREIIGETKTVNYTPEPNVFEQFAKKIGASIGGEIAKVYKPSTQLQ